MKELRDAPGGPAFIERCTTAAADLALFFVGQPEDKMMVALYQTQADIEADLAGTFGADVAGAIAAAFVDAVVCRRREIEAGGEMPRVLY